MFSESSTLEEVFGLAGMEFLKKYVSSDISPVNLSFQNLCRNCRMNWSPKGIAAGFSRIQEIVAEGISMELPLYENWELDTDTTTRQAGLLYFPADLSAVKPRPNSSAAPRLASTGRKGFGYQFLYSREGYRPFAVICPGGAYHSVCNIAEGFPIAAALNKLGISAFVLQYRTNVRGTAEKAEKDLHRAIQYLLLHRQELKITDNYAVFGFSAGGHLAAEFGTDNRGYRSCNIPKPQMICLGYPFVRFSEGKDFDDMAQTMFIADTSAVRAEFSPFFHISSNFPKTFLWGAADDDLVPFAEQAGDLYRKLRIAKVPCTLKTVISGGHGMGSAEGTEAEGWISESVDFWFSGAKKL